MKKWFIFLVVLLFPVSVFAADVTDWLSVSGSATTVYQWLHMTKGYVDSDTNDKTKDRGSAVIDFNVSLKPTENDEFFLRASFAKGSGFHSESANYPFVLNPNADDLFVDLRNINGHARDHLQELWYSHRFPIEKEVFLKLTAGIIDSTAFIDDNAYAADELQQFMNEALVHNPLANLPSYDAGVAAEFEAGKFHLRVVGMRSKNENETMDVKRYNWIGAQIGYKLETGLGEGNYRIYGYTTNKKFENWDADAYKALKGIGVSFDQQLLKDTLGAFFRAGWQDDSAQRVNYNRMVSLGLNLNGSVWGRKDDEVGVGYAYLKTPSKNEELKHSQVFESYVKFKLFSYKFLSSDITLDYQYIRDTARESDNTKAGHVYGVRFNINF
ncbi:carbohydrate porin [Thermodesulfovibrio sp. 3907-1M]|uniref:Carbohydrate porin n=1 Tax=Thermodesulfovibrio autotrophicus TaxID=3118333 RepID=A0AAU8GV65_9BACT